MPRRSQGKWDAEELDDLRRGFEVHGRDWEAIQKSGGGKLRSRTLKAVSKKGNQMFPAAARPLKAPATRGAAETKTETLSLKSGGNGTIQVPIGANTILYNSCNPSSNNWSEEEEQRLVADLEYGWGIRYVVEGTGMGTENTLYGGRGGNSVDRKKKVSLCLKKPEKQRIKYAAPHRLASPEHASKPEKSLHLLRGRAMR